MALVRYILSDGETHWKNLPWNPDKIQVKDRLFLRHEGRLMLTTVRQRVWGPEGTLLIHLDVDDEEVSDYGVDRMLPRRRDR